ncbi:DUF397 domain-containing protein [Streptomyces virginiae]|uniref:DUF397 domain-containing protein n=1 Tax=Streptomyces virginiae TaxID=1961 RepID=UPI00386EB9E3|nr:DUF397 domain-containing protein [Streptomyces virginiae]
MRTDVNGLSWRKSSYSNSESASCIEVSDDLLDVVPVRDSKQGGAGPVLVFPAVVWSSFILDVKAQA